ncbi:hypothetical protein ACKFRV_02590 [Corynebacterium amycolatum]|uniref:hypothetical protein n=1 Tax=Corynebacterium amycolatum TaxID=43765 RepID=UPI0038CF5A21
MSTVTDPRLTDPQRKRVIDLCQEIEDVQHRLGNPCSALAAQIYSHLRSHADDWANIYTIDPVTGETTDILPLLVTPTGTVAIYYGNGIIHLETWPGELDNREVARAASLGMSELRRLAEAASAACKPLPVTVHRDPERVEITITTDTPGQQIRARLSFTELSEFYPKPFIIHWSCLSDTDEDSLEYPGDGFMPPLEQPWSDQAYYLWSRMLSGERHLSEFAESTIL